MTREEALQAVVAGEHAAVYAFGVVGGRLEGTPRETAARTSWEEHRQRRDRATALLVADGATVPAAAAAYDLGGPVVTPTAARRLAAGVELSCCGPYADLVATGGTAERATAADWLAASATDAVTWGGSPATFPGLPERA